MSETKHTPGPWVADTTKQYSAHSRVNCVDKLICSVGNGESPDVSFDEWAANARLIAAAPDLLEALKACAAIIHIQNGNRFQDTNAILEMARLALTKATLPSPSTPGAEGER